MIDQAINKILLEFQSKYDAEPELIEQIVFQGSPNSVRFQKYQGTEFEPLYLLAKQIDHLIIKTDWKVCYESKSSYVRLCKQFYIDSGACDESTNCLIHACTGKLVSYGKFLRCNREGCRVSVSDSLEASSTLLKFIEDCNAVNKKCPRCGAPLIKRQVKHGKRVGSYFVGCTRYPSCNYGENL